MKALPVDFRDLLEEFDRSGVEVVLVGGYAVAFHGRPRATKHIDLVVRGTSENLHAAADALDRFGAPANVVAAMRVMKPSEVIFMGRPPLRIDLLQTIDGVDSDGLFDRAITALVGELKVRVISLPDLIANKRAAGRPQDLLDADLLTRMTDGTDA
jgi:predicted nucleotidyltransferase